MLVELALLLVKMVFTAGVVVTASLVAERSGPLAGGLIIALPISAGPGLLFLALQSSDTFLANTALYSLAMTAATVSFLLVYPRLAVRHGAVVSIGATLLVWSALGLVLERLPITLPLALALNLAAFSAVFLLPRPPGLKRPPRPARVDRRELLGRAAIAGTVVATVVTISAIIGSRATGILIVFPVAFTSIAFIMHRRHGGGPAAATLLASAVGMTGFVCFLTALHLLAEPLGGLAALGAALIVNLLASAAIALVAVRRPAAPLKGATP
ncbi:MAG: hypothetical protein AB7O45_12495 [Alphaproteobacteria bacterium]